MLLTVEYKEVAAAFNEVNLFAAMDDMCKTVMRQPLWASSKDLLYIVCLEGGRLPIDMIINKS